MATQVDAGPATGNAEYWFGATAGVEFHAQIGSNPLPPSAAPYIDPQSSYSGTVVNKMAAGVQVTVPA